MNDVDLVALLPSLLALGVLVAASAFFSGTEVAMFSLRRVDREQLARSGDSRDARLLRLLTRPGRLIATILIGNEVVNVSISAIMAGVCQRLFAGHVDEFEMAIFAVVLALPLLLLFGEIAPKNVAIKSSMPWSRRATTPLYLFGLLVTPVRVVVRLVADLIVRPLGLSTERSIGREMSEDEFKALVDAGSAEGEVNPRERRLIHKVFEFGDKSVSDVMTARKNVFALSYDLSVPRLLEQLADRGYSRVPIFRRSLDNVRGILYAKDLVIQGAEQSSPRRLAELLHEPLFVVQTMPIERLFRIFKQRHTHMALVVNEYGKVAGLVTMEDVLEELFGEIRDEREGQKQRVPVRAATSGSQPIAAAPAEEEA